MPQLQVVDFGEEPGVDSLLSFAKGFSDTYFQKQKQKKNEDIFKRIQANYGPDAEPDRIFKDILEAEGLDEDYKKDLLGQVKDYVSLASKKQITPYQDALLNIREQELKIKQDKAERGDEEKPLTAYQKQNIELQRIRLDNEKKRIENAAKQNSVKLPKLISDYTNNILKDAEDKLHPSDKALLNKRVQENVQDEGMSTEEAFNEAYNYLQIKNEVLNTTQIKEKPTRFFGSASPQEVESAMEAAYKQLDELYEAGIESQRDLREVAYRGGWSPEETTMMLQEVFKRHGRKIRSKAPSSKEETASVDDILFGE